MIDYLYDKIAAVEDVDALHVVTNSRFAGDFRAWAETGDRPSIERALQRNHLTRILRCRRRYCRR